MSGNLIVVSTRGQSCQTEQALIKKAGKFLPEANATIEAISNDGVR